MENKDYKDLSVLLKISGVIGIISGALFALMIPLMIAGMILMKSLGTAQAMSSGIYISASFVYAIMAAVSIVLGIGSFRLKKLARAVAEALGWIMLVGGIVAMITMPFFMGNMYSYLEEQTGMSMGFMEVFAYVTMFFIYIVGPGVILLVYGNRNAIRTCEEADPEHSWADNVPRKVMPLVMICFMAVFGLLTVIGYNAVFPLFGAILTGLPGFTAIVVVSAAFVFAGLKVMKLDIAGWWLSLGLIFVLQISNMITFSQKGLIDLYEKMNFPEAQLELIRGMDIGAGPIVIMLGVMLVLTIAYMLWIRRYFTPEYKNPEGILPNGIEPDPDLYQKDED